MDGNGLRELVFNVSGGVSVYMRAFHGNELKEWKLTVDS